MTWDYRDYLIHSDANFTFTIQRPDGSVVDKKHGTVEKARRYIDKLLSDARAAALGEQGEPRG